jgi:hypothetical protein
LATRTSVATIRLTVEEAPIDNDQLRRLSAVGPSSTYLVSGISLSSQLHHRDSGHGRKSPDHPLIIITGKPSVRSEAFYLASGAVGFFRKPVDGDELLELIGSVCAQN